MSKIDETTFWSGRNKIHFYREKMMGSRSDELKSEELDNRWDVIK
jgi:hypothetical protein